MKVAQYAKALAAALTAAAGTYITAAADSHVTTAEWMLVGASAVAAAGIVWAVPNKPAAVK
jgi:hypothetical protein